MRDFSLLVLLLLAVIQYGSSTAKENSPLKDKQLLLLNVTSSDKFYFRRFVRDEKSTCETYEKVVAVFKERVRKELDRTVADANETFEKIRTYITDESGKKCIVEKQSELENALKTETDYLRKEADKIPQEKKRLMTDLEDKDKNCQEAKDLAIKSADDCLKKIPNERRECLEKKFSDFEKGCRPLLEVSQQSPCMKSFKDKVLQKIVTSANSITFAANLILEQMKSHCTGSVKNKNTKDLIMNMDFVKFVPTIIAEVENVEREYDSLNREVEGQMQFYYNQEYSARTILGLTPRAAEDFKEILLERFFIYFNSIKKYYKELKGSTENGEQLKGIKKCYDDNIKDLNGLVETASQDFETCEKNNYELRDANITAARSILFNQTMQSTADGNAVIFKCIQGGFIFDKSPISNCFKLDYKFFLHEWSKTYESIKETLNGLQLDNIEFLRHQIGYPCDYTRSQKLELDAMKVVTLFEKCVNTKTGRN